MKTLAIIGAGGNAREIAGIVRDGGQYQFVGFLANMRGPYDSPALGDFSWLDENRVDCLAMGVGAPQVRLSLGRMLAEKYPEVEWPALVHPSAYVGPTCTLARGALVCVRAIATENVQVGEFAQLNFGCSVGHETRIGAGCIVNPGANVSGGVVIGDGAMIGSGAQILQYRSIGANVIVGAGAVVAANVADGAKVVGVPARPV
ncbi:MAG: hypothetical protein KGL46_11660 [Hyphomicrobiales bacterium]|nr:hypothetical protein [Hyphomicrobiales bacterium]